MKNTKAKMETIKELYDNNLIDENTYTKAAEYYTTNKSSNNLINNLIGIGVFFIALSMITFFAINWNEFGITIRACLSLLPILITIGIFGIAFFNEDEKKKVLWKNILSIFAPIGIIASNALIDQTFQIQTDFYEIIVNSMWMFIPVLIYTFKWPTIGLFMVGTAYSLGMKEWQSFIFLGLLLGMNIYLYLKNNKDQKTYIMSVFNLILIMIGLESFEILSEIEFLFCGLFFLELLTYLYKENEIKIYKFVSRFFEIIFVLICLIETDDIWNYSRIALWITLVLYVLMFIFNKSYKDFRKTSTLALSLSFLTMIQPITNIVFILISGMYFYSGYSNKTKADTMRGLSYITIWGLSKLFMSEMGFNEKTILFFVLGVIFIVLAKVLNKRLEVKKDEENI